MSDVIIKKARKIYQMYQNGDLGNTTLHEDSNPHLDPNTNDNFHVTNGFKLLEKFLYFVGKCPEDI